MTRKFQQLTVALLLAGLALILTLTPTRADNPPTFVLMWGSGVNGGAGDTDLCTTTASCQAGSMGDGSGQFASPSGVAVDGTGNVYVADTGNHRIQKFDSDGNFLFMWGAGVDGGTGDICTTAVNCQAGTSGDGAGQFNSPAAVAIDSAGNIYVAEVLNHRIQKFNSTGNFLRMWGAGVDGGTGDICTTAVNCQAGTPNGGAGQLNSPVGLAIDSTDNVYVAENLNRRIQKFDSSGNFILMWGAGVDGGTGDICTTAVNCQAGTSNSGNGQFNLPAGVAIDSTDKVYVSDSGSASNIRIQKFDSGGNYMIQWPLTAASPAGVAVDGQDNVYVTDIAVFHRVQKFDSGGTFLSTWGSLGPGAGQFNVPAGVAADDLSNVYVVESSYHRVQKFEQRLLAITKTVNNDTPRSGDRITYTISVHNGGAISATNAVISDTLPAGLTFAGPVGLAGSSGTVAQNAGELPALASNVTITNGSTITITFPVTVNAGLAPNTVINNTAAVTSTEEGTPQTASTLITVNAVDLAVLKIPSRIEDHFPNPGQLITYTIFVTNSGVISATNAVVSDTLPDGLTFAGPVGLEGSSGIVALNAGDLPTLASGLTIPNNASIKVTLPVTVNTGQDDGTLIFNVAAVTSDEVTTPEYGLGFTIVLSDTTLPIFPSNPLITPTQGITLDTLFPLFEWYAALDNGQVLTYLLTLSSTLDVLSAQSTSISFTTSQTSFVSPIPLSSGDYFWTVQAQDAAGNVNNPPIPSQSFTIVADSKKTYLPIIIKN